MANKKKNDFLIKYTEVQEDTGTLGEITKLNAAGTLNDRKSSQEELKEEFTPPTPPTPQI